jgi:hypothetical protein
MSWISVTHWRRFQHYDPAKRTPPWIKVYTELMSDDAFVGLSAHLRGILVSVWMEYAAARCQLRADTATLSRRLGVRVTVRDLDSLNHAGFLTIVASKTLADGYQGAGEVASARARATETEEETEVEKEKTPTYLPTEVRGEEPVGREGFSENGEPFVIPDVLKEIPW